MTENVAQRAPQPRRAPHLQLVVLGIGVAVAATVVLFFVLTGSGDKTTTPANGGPALVSQAQLERLAGSMNYPVYWAGPKEGYSYELTTTNGRIYIRYLPSGVKAGDRHADFLVVGTYTQSNSFGDLKRAAKRAGGISLSIDKGGLAVFNAKAPTNVYFTYPDAKYQVEVFSPSATTARSLVLAGKIEPIK
jgi:hypothetical protein